MRRLLLLFAACLLSSCVFRQVDEGLAALRGENIRAAIQVMGYPTRKMELGEGTVYTWANVTGGIDYIPGSAQAYSMVGSTPVTTTVSYTTAVPTSYSCQISIETDKAGTILSSSSQGQLGALEAYSLSLARFARAKKKRLEQQAAGLSQEAATPPQALASKTSKTTSAPGTLPPSPPPGSGPGPAATGATSPAAAAAMDKPGYVFVEKNSHRFLVDYNARLEPEVILAMAKAEAAKTGRIVMPRLPVSKPRPHVVRVDFDVMTLEEFKERDAEGQYHSAGH